MRHPMRFLTWTCLLAFCLAPAALAGSHDHDARGYLGVDLDDLTPQLQEHFGAADGLGVMISSVEEDSPAWKGGLRVGDVVTRIDGRPIEDAWDAVRTVRDLPGETIDLEIVRDGREQELRVELGERRHERYASHHRRGILIEGDMEDLEVELERLGRQMETLGEEIGRQVEIAMDDVEWDEIGRVVGRSLESSLRALEALDGVEIEIDLDEMETQIERSLEDLEISLEGLEDELDDLDVEISGPAT